MPTQRKPNVQCFVKHSFEPSFAGDNQPRLLYISKIPPEQNAHPRVMHAHPDFIEIGLIYSGVSEYLLDHKKQYIRQGDLLIYNAGVVHDEVPTPDGGIGRYCIAVGGLHMPELRENALIPDSKGCVFPAGDSFTELYRLFEMMFQNLSTGAPQSETFCHHLMEAVLVKVLAIVNGTETPLAEEADVLCKRIKDYIDIHFAEPLTLQSIGETLRISPYYLSHVFKKETGYAPMQYLLRRRIGEAQTLLIMTDLPLSRIAEMVGYDTQSYFNLQFAKYVGMPPGKYRNFIVPDRKQKKTESPRKTGAPDD